MNNARVQAWLSWLVVFGVASFFCAPWVVSSNTYYHRLIIAFLWLPAFAHFLLLRRDYPPIDKTFLGGFLAFSVWFVLATSLTLESDWELRDLKLPFYVAWSLLGIMVCAMHLREKFAGFLLLCCLLGGLGAAFSLVDFYLLQGHSWRERVVSSGIWRVIIPAAQASGALVILAAMLGLRDRRKPLLIAVTLLALVGYTMFLYFNQTRWVWLSVVLSFLGVSLLSRSRTAFAMTLIAAALVSLILLLQPGVLLNRGLSYRPELWLSGFNLMLDNWVHGLGMREYWLEMSSLSFRSRHPHNMYLDIGIRYGVIGLLLWVGMWCWAGWRAFQNRHTHFGTAVLALWIYSGLVVLTEGGTPWVKPSPIWFVTWLPVALALVLDMQARQRARSQAAVGEPDAARHLRSSQ